jgi:hypothetical protein
VGQAILSHASFEASYWNRIIDSWLAGDKITCPTQAYENQQPGYGSSYFHDRHNSLDIK